MRAITGCKVGTSQHQLYREAGLTSLRDRQLSAAKVYMYDVYHEYRNCRLKFSDLTKIQRANPYAIRISHLLRPIKCNTECFRMSFLLYGIQLLNQVLNVKPQCLTTLTRDQFNYIYTVQFTRKSHVLLSRLRCLNSVLLSNLFNINLSTTNVCQNCLFEIETMSHFFIKCSAYDEARSMLCKQIPIECWNLDSIVFGSKRYTNEYIQIQITTQKYILATGRFP